MATRDPLEAKQQNWRKGKAETFSGHFDTDCAQKFSYRLTYLIDEHTGQ